MSKKPTPEENDTTGKWRARTGVHAPLDTGLLRALDGSTGAEESQETAAGVDPYNQTIPNLQDSSGIRKRRSLDDMRRLSEMIKADRSEK